MSLKLQIEVVDRKEDARGALLKLWPAPVGGEVYAVQLRPGFPRGRHYHRRGAEHFIALVGRPVLVVEDPATGQRQVVVLDGVRVTVPAGLAHAFFATDHDALVLAIAELRPDQDETVPWPVAPP